MHRQPHDEAIVYDAAGKELAHFNMGSAIRFTAFKSAGRGTQTG